MIARGALAATALALVAAAGAPRGDPGGAWRAWNRPKVQRTSFTLTALADGRVLLVGGDFAARPPASPLEHSAEVLDPRTGIWSLTDPLPGHRVHPAVAALQKGGALLAGGLDHLKIESTRRDRFASWTGPPGLSASMLGSAQWWDPVRGWRAGGNMTEKRTAARAATLADGRVLVTGGRQVTYGPSYMDPSILRNGNPRFLASAEIWSPATGKWQPTAPMSQPRHGHTATALADGRVLVVGGAPAEAVSGPTAVPAEIWSPLTGQWTPIARPHHEREGHTATRLADGRVLIAGGRLPPAPYGPLPKDLAAAEVWDPRTGDWTDVSPMQVPRIGHDAVLLGDGRVLVAGAGPPEGEVWDAATDRWTMTPPFTAFMAGDIHLAPLPDGSVVAVSPVGVQLWTP